MGCCPSFSFPKVLSNVFGCTIVNWCKNPKEWKQDVITGFFHNTLSGSQTVHSTNHQDSSLRLLCPLPPQCQRFGLSDITFWVLKAGSTFSKQIIQEIRVLSVQGFPTLFTWKHMQKTITFCCHIGLKEQSFLQTKTSGLDPERLKSQAYL